MPHLPSPVAPRWFATVALEATVASKNCPAALSSTVFTGTQMATGRLRQNTARMGPRRGARGGVVLRSVADAASKKVQVR